MTALHNKFAYSEYQVTATIGSDAPALGYSHLNPEIYFFQEFSPRQALQQCLHCPHLTEDSWESLGTQASESIHQVSAAAPVLAGIALTLVGFYLTVLPCETARAQAVVTIHFILHRAGRKKQK